MDIGNGLQENLLNENDFILRESIENKVVKKKRKRKDKNNYDSYNKKKHKKLVKGYLSKLDKQNQ